MASDIGIERVDDYLQITYTGPFSLEGARRTVDAMVSACARERLAKVLLDCRSMTGGLSVISRFDMAQYGASTIPHSIRVAVLGRPDQMLPDRFFENAARNRGLMVTLFTAIDEAIEWLEG
ncbi:MAG: hypothetical protein PVJ49_06925 [Acidobacteriota bacterium]|jgi:hypothetical protein